MSDRLIYFFWEGGPMSYLRYMTLFSFKKYNPGWTVRLVSKESSTPSVATWGTEERQDFTSYFGEDYSSRCAGIGVEQIDFDISYNGLLPDSMSPIHRKDLLNWYIMGTEQCVVADMDILFISSLTSEFSRFIDSGVELGLVCFPGVPRAGYVPISIMFSNRSEYAFRLFRSGLERYDPLVYESCGSVLLDEDMPRRINSGEVFRINEKIIFPHTTYFSFGDSMNYMYKWRVANIDEASTCGIHWYAGNPASQKFNSMITESTYRDFNNTMTYYIEKAINA